jgi:hypothetical protein
MSFCAKCGAQLAPDARFCPKCGTPAPERPVETVVAGPPPPVIPPPAAPRAAPTATPPAAVPPASSYRTTAERPLPGNAPVDIPAAKRSTWWIVPAVIVGLVLIAWLLLAGLPFGRDEKRTTGTTVATETVAEGTSTASNEPITGTVIEVPGVDEPATTETTQPPLDTAPAQTTGVAPPPQSPQPPPRVIEEPPVRTTTPPPPQRTIPPPARTTPAPVRTPPAAPPAAPSPVPTPAPAPARTGEISDAEAAATLRSYIASNSYYEGVSGDCVQVRSQGYSNVGYTYSVWDGCVSGGGSRMLGRWRVDSKTREVFRQQSDGRFLRP